MSATRSPPPTARQLFTALVIANGLLVFAYLLRLPFHDTWLGHARLFDLNAESGFGTWVSSTQFLLLAALAGSIALTKEIAAGPSARLVWAFAALFVVLSVDETAQVHEAIGHLSDALLPGHDRTATAVPHTGVWMFLLGPPLIVAFGGFGWKLRSVFERAPGSATAFGRGTAVWLGGALGLELLSNFTEYYETWNVLQVAAEEGCELLGVSMMVRAMFTLAIAWRSTDLDAPHRNADLEEARLDLSVLESALDHRHERRGRAADPEPERARGGYVGRRTRC